MNKILENGDVKWLLVILIGAAALRLFMFADFSSGSIRFVGTCGQLLDEVKPPVESNNPLHFEVFFYPPVAPLIVSSTALVTQAILPAAFDLGLYCLFVNIMVSVGTIVPIYLIGREWGPKEGLVAAAFYAVTMIAVVSCNNVQAYPTFFAMFAIYFFYRSLRWQTALNLTLMGVFFGLAVASKYFPAMLFLMLFLVYLLVREDSPRDFTERVNQTERKRASHRLPALAWNGMLYSLVLITVGILYLGMFHRESVLGMFKTIYSAHQHEHSFEYHLPTIIRLYYVGIVATVGTGLIAGLGILLPHLAELSPWEWFNRFCRRNRLWLIPFSSMIATLGITLGIPAALNLNNYLKYTSWIAKAYTSTDSGMFPHGSPAPSYLLSFFPENLGLPLFIVGCIGIAYLLVVRDKKAILLLIVAMPLYVALELSAVKVNRFAQDLMPLFCLFAGILVVRLGQSKSSMAYKAISFVTFLTVFLYSALYSLAWANFERVRRDIQVQTVEWINIHVPPASRIGMKAEFWLSGSPTLLPDPDLLKKYNLASYTDYPEYILFPKLLSALFKQYDDLSRSGYTYRPDDWSPLPPPSPNEREVLLDIVRQKHYQLVNEIDKFPSLFGIDFRAQAIGRKTWFLEHAGAYGVQIYRRRTIEETTQRRVGNSAKTS